MSLLLQQSGTCLRGIVVPMYVVKLVKEAKHIRRNAWKTCFPIIDVKRQSPCVWHECLYSLAKVETNEETQLTLSLL